MGIDGIEELTDNEPVEKTPRSATHDKDQEDQKQAELQAEREEHNRRTAGSSAER